MFESENRKSSDQNRKIEIGIIEAELRIEATQLTRRIVTAALLRSEWAYSVCLRLLESYKIMNPVMMTAASMAAFIQQLPPH